MCKCTKAVEIELAYLRKKIEELTDIIKESKVEEHTHVHYEVNNFSDEDTQNYN